jgi:hypothetical protein
MVTMQKGSFFTSLVAKTKFCSDVERTEYALKVKKQNNKVQKSNSNA